MRVSARSRPLKRDQGSTQNIVIILVVVISVLVVCIITWIACHGRRAKRNTAQQGSRKRQSWRDSLATLSSAFHRPPQVRADVRDSTFSANSRDLEMNVAGEEGVDRHTSVRSVMTLPAYSAVPREGEGVIGREGERAGMDTVVEFPEAAEEEEARREEEMEALYQIRMRRREEAAQRHERRRLRREARARGDFETVYNLRRESILRADEREETGSDALIRARESHSRERRVSAVSYGDLGVARHDGSRVRANSNESDRPLLDTAGPLGVSGPVRPWMSTESFGHRRGRSSTTNLSMTSYDSDDNSAADDSGSEFDSLSLRPTSTRPRSRQHSMALSLTGSGTRSRATSFGHPLAISTDISDVPIPAHDPPQYESAGFEEAPPYESPVRTRAPETTLPRPDSLTRGPNGVPQLPAIQRLPSIRITEGTPIELRQHDFPDFSNYTPENSTDRGR